MCKPSIALIGLALAAVGAMAMPPLPGRGAATCAGPCEACAENCAACCGENCAACCGDRCPAIAKGGTAMACAAVKTDGKAQARAGSCGAMRVVVAKKGAADCGCTGDCATCCGNHCGDCCTGGKCGKESRTAIAGVAVAAPVKAAKSSCCATRQVVAQRQAADCGCTGDCATCCGNHCGDCCSGGKCGKESRKAVAGVAVTAPVKSAKSGCCAGK